MKCVFLNGNGSSKLIVIFAGWSTDSSFYSRIAIPGWDIMVVSDYSHMDFPSHIIEKYDSIALFAWSLGVYAASRCFPFEKASLSVAVNGTEHPVNDTLGIPVNIFKGTADSLSERNLLKFRRRMTGDLYKSVEGDFSCVPIDDLKAQLNFIGKHYASSVSENSSHWDKVYVSKNDMIFPAAAQKRAWSEHLSHPQVIELDSPHYVDLLPIISAALPSHDKVGKRFRKALPTYNDTATPQKIISNHLVDFLNEISNEAKENIPLNDILEIGPGTGFLTDTFSNAYKPQAIDYVELYEPPHFHAAEIENYYIADAESWLSEAAANGSRRYDAIISASAIQWFVNPMAFFSNASRLLKPGGILLCSTFLPGNLKELLAVNPYGLVYHSAERLRKLLSLRFSNVETREECIKLTFSSPRDMLLHLVKTGVGGTSQTTLSMAELLNRLPCRLTYKPLYIFAKSELPS